MKSSYTILSSETEMLQCRASQLRQELSELEMLYSCTHDRNLMNLHKKTKKQYDSINRQILKNKQKLDKYNGG
jgi:hypothetical protein